MHQKKTTTLKYKTMQYLPNRKCKQISLELELIEYTGVVEHKMV